MLETPMWSKSPQLFGVSTQASKSLLQGRENMGDFGRGPLARSEN